MLKAVKKLLFNLDQDAISGLDLLSISSRDKLNVPNTLNNIPSSREKVATFLNNSTSASVDLTTTWELNYNNPVHTVSSHCNSAFN